MLVREIITLKGWVDGSGWIYSQCYSDSIIEITSFDDISFDWWEIDVDNLLNYDYDTKIIVDLYSVNADISNEEPLASYSKWASEILAERNK